VPRPWVSVDALRCCGRRGPVAVLPPDDGTWPSVGLRAPSISRVVVSRVRPLPHQVPKWVKPLPKPPQIQQRQVLATKHPSGYLLPHLAPALQMLGPLFHIVTKRLTSLRPSLPVCFPPSGVPDWSQLQRGPIRMARVSAHSSVYGENIDPKRLSVPRPCGADFATNLNVR
jgi:hypothetical protein